MFGTQGSGAKGSRSLLYISFTSCSATHYITMSVVVILLVIVAASAIARPADDKAAGCNTKDDSFNECFMNTGNHIFEMLSKGDKKMGLPVLDPLQVKNMDVLHSGKNMHIKIQDATHRGLGKAVIHSAKADPEHYKFQLDMTVPQYNIKGVYDMNAKIAMLPVMGQGNADITLKNVSMTWDIQGKAVEKKGKQYMEITDFKVSISPKAMSFHMDNLFNGNKELGSTMNTFFNDNWKDVYMQLKPEIEKSFAELMKAVGSKLLEKVAYNNMFPDMKM